MHHKLHACNQVSETNDATQTSNNHSAYSIIVTQEFFTRTYTGYLSLTESHSGVSDVPWGFQSDDRPGGGAGATVTGATPASIDLLTPAL